MSPSKVKPFVLVLFPIVIFCAFTILYHQLYSYMYDSSGSNIYVRAFGFSNGLHVHFQFAKYFVCAFSKICNVLAYSKLGSEKNFLLLTIAMLFVFFGYMYVLDHIESLAFVPKYNRRSNREMIRNIEIQVRKSKKEEREWRIKV